MVAWVPQARGGSSGRGTCGVARVSSTDLVGDSNKGAQAPLPPLD